MSWFVEVQYKAQDGNLKTETFINPNKGLVHKHYHQWARNPERFATLKLFERHLRNGIRVKPRLHMSQQGYMFDDEIPF